MKRSEHLRPLSLNHYDGLIAARRLQIGIEKNADPGVMRDYVLHLWETHLKAHCLQEEEHLLPELNRLCATAMKDRLMGDHRTMGAIVEHLQIVEDPRPYLRKMAELLNQHIRFEERKLFPFLERQLGGNRLRRIGRYLHADHEEADHQKWSPAFWA